MTKHITIPLATLEQIVVALEGLARLAELQGYNFPEGNIWHRSCDTAELALTAGRAALDGAEQGKRKPAAYIVHRAMSEPYISYRKVKDALRNEPLYKEQP